MADQPTPDTAAVQAVPVHQDMGGSFYSLSYLVDAAGNQYAAVANEQLSNSNITWAEVHIAPAGQGFPQTPAYRVNPTNKIDRVSIFNSGHDLIVSLVTHSTSNQYPPGTPRPICIEQARINGIFATTPDFVAQRGGEGAVIVPADPLPPADVDYTRIQTIVESALGATSTNSLVTQITAGHGSVRTNIRNMAKEALVYLMDPANDADPNDPEHLAQKWHAEFYSYVANLLWGQLAKFGDEVGYKPPKP